MGIYGKLLMIAMVTVALTAVFTLLEMKTAFGRLSYKLRQVIIGFFFGLAAIMGTEFGVDVGGAFANVRDAAPLCAGLFFGGPAGIIAGLIGGIERWFAVYWGSGMYSRVACSVSTMLAGVYAAFLRKMLFDNHRPSWGIGFVTGIVMEVIHLSILFLTHITDATEALRIVQIVTLPMVFGNAVAVMLSVVIVDILNHEFSFRRKGLLTISSSIQNWLLKCIVVAYLLSTTFVFAVQTGTAMTDATALMKLNITDVEKDIMEAADNSILKINRKIAAELEKGNYDFDFLTAHYEVTEINIVNREGIITQSTDPAYVGFDMKSGEQSAAFLALNRGEESVVQNYQPAAYDENDASRARKYAGIALKKGGFVQVGYNGKRFQEELASVMQEIGKNRHLGEHGIILITDSDGLIISNDEALHKIPMSLVLKGINEKTPEDTMVSCTNRGEKSRCMYSVCEGYRIYAVIPETQIFSSRNASVYVNSFMEVLVFALLFLAIYYCIKYYAVDEIHKVNKSLARIIGGDLNETISANATSEMKSLSDDINSTVATLKQYIADAEKRIDEELEFARNIQYSSLPSVFPAFPGNTEFDIYAAMDTAKEVGGDFYDFFMIGERKLAFLIADVSGKGIPAAMFMMRAKTAIKTLAESGLSAEKVMQEANDRLCTGNDAGMFVTAWFGILDIRTGKVECANAGHNPPLIYRNGEGWEFYHTKPSLVLAGMEGIRYRLNEFTLKPGERLFLYTDGVTEAENTSLELFGNDRLKEVLNRVGNTLSIEETLKEVRKEVDIFAGEAPQFDDITMLGLLYNGGGKSTGKISRIFNADRGCLDEAQNFVDSALLKAGGTAADQMKIDICLEEVFVNIADYAYPGKKDGKMIIEVESEEKKFTMRFIDFGTEFDPLAKEDPDITLSAKERQIGGLGIFMVKKMMDEVNYEQRDGMNILTMMKVIGKNNEAEEGKDRK